MATFGIDKGVIELLRTYHKYVLLPKQIGPEVRPNGPRIEIKWKAGFPDRFLTILGSDESVSHIELSMDPQTGDVNIWYVSDNFKSDAEFIKELIRKYATIKIPAPAEPDLAAPPAPPTPRLGLASAKAAASNLLSKAKGIFSRGGKRSTSRRRQTKRGGYRGALYKSYGNRDLLDNNYRYAKTDPSTIESSLESNMAKADYKAIGKVYDPRSEIINLRYNRTLNPEQKTAMLQPLYQKQAQAKADFDKYNNRTQLDLSRYGTESADKVKQAYQIVTGHAADLRRALNSRSGGTTRRRRQTKRR